MFVFSLCHYGPTNTNWIKTQKNNEFQYLVLLFHFNWQTTRLLGDFQVRTLDQNDPDYVT